MTTSSARRSYRRRRARSHCAGLGDHCGSKSGCKTVRRNGKRYCRKAKNTRRHHMSRRSRHPRRH